VSVRLVAILFVCVGASGCASQAADYRVKFDNRTCRPEGELFCAIGIQDDAKMAELIVKGINVNAPGPIGGYEPSLGLPPWRQTFPSA